MAKLPLVFKGFAGGLATDLKSGIKNSFAGTAGAGSLGSYAVDFRRSPSQLTVLPKPVREDNGIVTDLVQNEVMTRDGTIYAIGSTGGFYKRTTAGLWSREANINVGTYGIDYRYDTDSIYLTQNKSVSLYNNVSGTNGTPAMYMSFYGQSFSTYNNSDTVGFNVSAYQAGSAQTTRIGTSVLEQNTALRYFQSDIEPLAKISVFVTAKGTGDWTLTLHDGLNNVLATKTITNANLTNNVFNDFTFTTPVRIYVAANIGNGIISGNARTYHFHLTSTVADGTVSSSAINDLSTCDLQVWADRMVMTQNGMHPMIRFQQYEIIGNGNYISAWEPLTEPPTNNEWLRHRLTFPSEYEVCGLSVFNEYLAIACEKSTSSNTSVPQEGLIFWWDGVSPTYNYLTKIPEGSPQGIHEYKNVIYYFAGGAWYAIGSPASNPVKIRTMPGSATEYSGAAAPLKVYPYAATVRRGIHLMGYPSMTTDTSINYGVYSWGSVDKNFPESFGYNYLLSTGSTNYSVSNNLTIGMVKSFGDTLHISWRDTLNDGGYGVDVITNASAPATNATWESLIFDNGNPMKEKTGCYITASFLTLPSDCSFKIKYKLDRATSWTYSNEFTEAALLYPNQARFDVTSDGSGNRFFECQIGLDITSGTTSPTFTGITLVFDNNTNEDFS